MLRNHITTALLNFVHNKLYGSGDKVGRHFTDRQTFLHAGCGSAHKSQTTAAFAQPEWHELRLDIDVNVHPDIVGTITDMAAVATESVDAVFSSHCIEHIYAHEVPKALAEFRRVLKENGFAIIICPDLQSVCKLIAEDKLTETAYVSPAGPIAPLDILYGFRPQVAAGNLHMAHHCGFTKGVLARTLYAAGFQCIVRARSGPHFDLWAVAMKSPATEERMRALAGEHFP